MRIQRTSRRVLLGIVTAAALTGSALVAPAKAAPADSPAALAASDWMISELRNDLLSTENPDNPGWGTTKLYGPTLDGVLALGDIGAHPVQRAAMLDAVEAEAGSYVGTGAETYVGALGKLASTALVEGRDMQAFAGGGLLARLRDRVVTANNRQKGRVKDASAYGDYSSTYSQAWSVRALSLGRVRYRALATSFLLKQQCTAGYFRESLESSDFTCNTGRRQGTSSPDVDATALAVMALREARDAGVTRLGDDIRDALRWLVKAQRSNGAFVGTGVQNANSTGLAAWVLRTAGYDGPAARATTWLERRQVVAEDVVGTGLERHGGAVAYSPPAYAKALEDGIPEGADRSQWLVAVTQAIPGLVPPQ